MAVAKKKDKNKKKKHKPATKLILLEGGAAVAKRRQAAVEAAAAVAPSSTKGRNDGKLTLTGVRSKDTKMQVKRNKKKKKTGNTCVGAKAAEFLDAADPGIKFHNVDVDVADKDDVVELPLDQPTRELALAMEKFAPGRKIDGAGFDYYSDGPDPLHGRDIVMLWDEPRGWFLGHVSRREKMGALFPGRTRLKTTNGHMTWRIVFAEDARWSEYDLEDRTEAMDLLPGKRGPGDAMSACGQWVLLEKKKKKQKKKKTEEEKQKQEDTLRPMRTVIEDDNLFRWLKLHVEKKGLAHVLGAVHLVAMDVDQESKKKKRA